MWQEFLMGQDTSYEVVSTLSNLFCKIKVSLHVTNDKKMAK